MANKMQVEFRKKVADEFVKMLENLGEDNDSLWEAPWFKTPRPMNGITKKAYTGVNAIWLRICAVKRNTNDPRWFTFNQIADPKGYAHKGKKWHLKADSTGENIEYWCRYDFTDKRVLRTDEEERQAIDAGHNVGPLARFYRVFNGQDIEGLEPWEPKEKVNVNVTPDEAIYKIAAGMGVMFVEDQTDRAFYVPTEDTVHLPKRERFKSSEGFNATALHELAHSTGHEKRLNRPIKNTFGNKEYAFEELVAELASVFASELLETPLTTKEFDNSKQYVASWISGIKEKPDALAQALKAADNAADYMAKAMS